MRSPSAACNPSTPRSPKPNPLAPGNGEPPKNPRHHLGTLSFTKDISHGQKPHDANPANTHELNSRLRPLRLREKFRHSFLTADGRGWTQITEHPCASVSICPSPLLTLSLLESRQKFLTRAADVPLKTSSSRSARRATPGRNSTGAELSARKCAGSRRFPARSGRRKIAA